MSLTRFFGTLTLLSALLIASMGVRADRIVLGPDGATLDPKGIKAEFAVTPYRGQQNISWLQYSLPQGLEIQTQFINIANKQRNLTSLDLQYPILSEFGQFPSLSVGVRDLLGTGSEHHSLYAAVGKSFILSKDQLKFAHDFRVTVGYGTERLDGAFIGFHSFLKAGVFVDAELYKRHPNISIALPLIHNMKARAYSLDGNIFYGLSYTLVR